MLMCNVLPDMPSSQFDRQWDKDPGFVFYDYKKPQDIPPELHHQFDYIVIDPPFITEEVWQKYSEAAKLLLIQPSPVAAAAPASSAADAPSSAAV